MGERVVCPGCGHGFIWADRFHHNASFVIHDLETTGLYPDEDEFIQIAAVRYHDGRLIAEDSFFSFARPRRSISSFIESYTGIGNRDVAGAPRPEEVLCRFSELLGVCFLREAPERAIGSDRRAGKWGLLAEVQVRGTVV